MLGLDTGATLSVYLDAEPSASNLHWATTYVDTDDDAVGVTYGETDGTTGTIMVSSPASGIRLIRQMSIYNSDTGAHTVNLELLDGVTGRMVVTCDVASQGTLSYDSSCGWMLPLSSSASVSVAHNDTTSKQGGTTDEYYHLTADELSGVQAIDPLIEDLLYG